jgi:hypothetical protein
VAGSPYDVYLSGYAFRSDSPNYELDLENVDPDALTITPAPLSGTVLAQPRVYGESTPAFEVQLEVFKYDDTQESVFDAGGFQYEVRQPGSAGVVDRPSVAGSPYDVYLSGYAFRSDSPNYRLDLGNVDPDALTITAALLSGTVLAQPRVYGESTPAFEAQLEGFKYDDTQGAVFDAGGFQYEVRQSGSEGVVDRPSVAGSPYDVYLSGYAFRSDSPNYRLDLGNVDPDALTITAALLSGTVLAQPRVYGESTPAFDAQLEGFKYDDTQGAVFDAGGFQYEVRQSGSEGVVDRPSVAGSPYDVYLSGYAFRSDSPNYQLDLGNVDPDALTITAALLSGTVLAQPRVYGESTPAFEAQLEGFKYDDTQGAVFDAGGFQYEVRQSGSEGVVDRPSVAGSPYDVYLSGYAFKSDSPNYQLDLGNVGPDELTITAAPLTLNINDTSRKIGEPNPTFDGIIEGFKYGETPSVLGDLYFNINADSESLPADNPYRIWSSGFQNSENSNYVFTNVREGQLMVESDIFLLDEGDVPRGNSAKPSVPDQRNTPQNQTDNSAAASSGSNTDAFGAPVFASQARRQGLAGQEDLLFSNGGNRELWGPSINR